MAHPKRVTFPGNVRFADPPPKDEKGKPLRLVRKNDAKGAFTGTIVVCPPGKRLTSTIAKGGTTFGGKTRPTYIVGIEDDTPVHAHADLEHVEAVPAAKATETTPATSATPAHVVATSTTHANDAGPIAAKGATAAEAVANLKAAVAAHVEATKPKPPEPPKEAPKTNAGDLPADHDPGPAGAVEPDALPKHDGEPVVRHG